jgi:hypothetical protein
VNNKVKKVNNNKVVKVNMVYMEDILYLEDGEIHTWVGEEALAMVVSDMVD